MKSFRYKSIPSYEECADPKNWKIITTLNDDFLELLLIHYSGRATCATKGTINHDTRWWENAIASTFASKFGFEPSVEVIQKLILSLRNFILL